VYSEVVDQAKCEEMIEETASLLVQVDSNNRDQS